MKKRKRESHFRKNLKLAFRNPLTYIYISIPVLLILTCVIVFDAEHELGMEKPFDAVWFLFVTFIAGYFDYSPLSVTGRIASLVMLLVGILTFSALTGKIASVFMEMQMKKDRGLVKLKMDNHFLICGWRPGFERILDAVLASNPDISPDSIVLVNSAPSEQMDSIRQLPRFKGINYISGDFSDESTLKRANLSTAERALIISDQSQTFSRLETDSRTVLAVLTIKNMNPTVYVAAELSDSKFQKHLQLAHCDEVILTSDYEYSLLATASSGMGYSNVISELIGKDADSGIIVEDIAKHWIGKTYGEFKKNYKKDGVIVGLLLNTGNFYLRKKDALREAQKNPDVNKVIDNLRKVKLLVSNQPLLCPDDSTVIQPNTKVILVKGKKQKDE